MSDKLRELRRTKQIPAKEIVAVIQRLYPKYDKVALSKCENGDTYGVEIKPDALDAVYAEFAPELLEAHSKPKKTDHRLPVESLQGLRTANIRRCNSTSAPMGTPLCRIGLQIPFAPTLRKRSKS